jgi:hypothetical protein
VQTAEDVALGNGMVVLDELRLDTGSRGESPAAVAFEDAAAVILEYPRLEDQYTGKLSDNRLQ